MTIGLLVILAATSTLLTSTRLSASVSDLSQLQQQGSYALHVIGMQLRQAGSSDPVLDGVGGRYVFGPDAATFGSMGAAVWGTTGSATASDSLSVASFAAPADGAPKSTWQRNCIGDAVEKGLVDATFTLDAKGQLQCRSGSRMQPLIENVADFRVDYEVDTGHGLQWLDAAAVEQSGLWAAVRAVEVCLDLKGSEQGPDAGSEYKDCGNTTKPRDGWTHLVFRNVFSLRVP